MLGSTYEGNAPATPVFAPIAVFAIWAGINLLRAASD
jgi:hypothetical protein